MRAQDDRRVRFGRTAILLLAWSAFLVAAVGLTARYAPVVNHVELLIAALSPYLMLAALVTFGVLWRIGDKRWATLALIPLVVGIGVRVPYHLADSPPDGMTTAIRVLTINLQKGTDEPAAAAAAAARGHADTLFVQELTPQRAAGILGDRALC